MAATDNKAPAQVTLYCGFPPSKLYAWSPFVTELEFALRYAGLQYTAQEGSTREGPSGKVPYIDIARLYQTTANDATSEVVGDSDMIIKRLVKEGTMRDLNADLSPNDKTLDAGVRGLCEDKLYFLGMSER